MYVEAHSGGIRAARILRAFTGAFISESWSFFLKKRAFFIARGADSLLVLLLSDAHAHASTADKRLAALPHTVRPHRASLLVTPFLLELDTHVLQYRIA